MNVVFTDVPNKWFAVGNSRPSQDTVTVAGQTVAI